MAQEQQASTHSRTHSRTPKRLYARIHERPARRPCRATANAECVKGYPDSVSPSQQKVRRISTAAADELLRASQRSAAVTRWQHAHNKVRLANRAAVASFNKAVRDDQINAEDPPGRHPFSVVRKVFRSHLLTQMVAKAEGSFEVTHLSLGQHTFIWETPITDPMGNELPAAELNLYMYPMITVGNKAPHEVRRSLERVWGRGRSGGRGGYACRPTGGAARDERRARRRRSHDRVP